MLTYRQVSVVYQNQAGNQLNFFQEPVQEEISSQNRPADQTRDVNGVKLEYRLDQYWILPASYEETGLTQEMEEWQKLPGHYISYGSDTPEQMKVGFLSWEQDGLRYSLLDMDGKESADTLFSMATQLMTK